MSTFCKLFRVFCIVFSRMVFSLGFLSSLSVGGLMITEAQAQGALFTVEGVQADVTAVNAIAAREKAFQEAQSKAFTELAQRMISGAELASFTPPQGLALSAMIHRPQKPVYKMATSSRQSTVQRLQICAAIPICLSNLPRGMRLM